MPDIYYIRSVLKVGDVVPRIPLKAGNECPKVYQVLMSPKFWCSSVNITGSLEHPVQNLRY